MKSLFILFTIVLNSLILLSNDRDNKINTNMKLFDKNGFQKQSNHSIDGNFSVGETNLNATYTVPISNQIINGYSLDFTINYNGGIEHKQIISGDGSNISSYSKKLPLWYLSVNGFVVQAFNENRTVYGDPERYKKTRYFCSLLDENEKYIFSNKDFNFSIPGYHYSNRFDKSPISQDFHDKIQILKSDGSTLLLYNPKLTSSGYRNNKEVLTGRYLEYGINTQGYAIVEYIHSPSNEECDSLINYYGSNRKRRKVRYFPGDGLEYVFIEYLTPYGTELTASTSGVSIPRSGLFHPQSGYYSFGGVEQNSHPRQNPTIFYLSEIYNDNQRMAEFYYDRHHPYENDICTDGTFGRAKLIHFNNHNIKYFPGYVEIQSYDRNIRIELHELVNGERENFVTFGGDIYNYIYNNQLNLYKHNPLALNIINSIINTNKHILRFGKPTSNLHSHYNGTIGQSNNYFYFIDYVRSIEIKEIKEKTDFGYITDQDWNETNKKIISFDYEEVIKEVDLSILPTTEPHILFPFSGDIADYSTGYSAFNSEIGVGCSNVKFKDAFLSSISIEELRLSEINEPSKKIRIEYYPNNSIDYLTLAPPNSAFSASTESFMFSNHCVEKVSYYDISNSYDRLVLEEENNIQFQLVSEPNYINNCEPNNSFSSYKKIVNNKNFTHYDENNAIFKTNSIQKQYLSFHLDLFHLSTDNIFDYTNYSTILPISTVNITNQDGITSLIGSKQHYTHLCVNDYPINMIKPFFNHSWINYDSGGEITTDLTFWEYEISPEGINLRDLPIEHEDFKNIFGREISKITEYKSNYPNILPSSSISEYISLFSTFTNGENYLYKTIKEFIHFPYKKYNNLLGNNKQFYFDDLDFLQRYYDMSMLLDGYDYSNMGLATRARNLWFSFYNQGPKMYSNTKLNNTQYIAYPTRSEEFNYKYFLCYLFHDVKDYPLIFVKDYGNTYIDAKPKLNVLINKSVFNENNQLLSKVEYEIEEEAYNGINLTYARGKSISEKVYESEYYNGDVTKFIVSNETLYSVGAQGGGYPGEILNPNGAKIRNYYVYNHNFHNNFHGYNPVHTVQDFWTADLLDSDNNPCSIEDYFMPSGKINLNSKSVRKDKLLESYNLFYRHSPVATRYFVRKYGLYNGEIELFDSFQNNGEPYTSPAPITNGLIYTPFPKEVYSLNNVYEYNDLGLQTAKIDFNGNIVRTEYDNFFRLKQLNLPYDYRTPLTGTIQQQLIQIEGISGSIKANIDIEWTCGLNDYFELYDIEITGTGEYDLDDATIGFISPFHDDTPTCSNGVDQNYTDYHYIKDFVVTFALPNKVEDIVSLTQAGIVLNIKGVRDTPKFENSETKFELSLTFENGVDDPELIYSDQLILEIPDFSLNSWFLTEPFIINLDNEKDDLINALTSNNSTFGRGKLVLRISCIDGMKNSSYYSAGGIIEFYGMEAEKSLKPQLVLRGDFTIREDPMKDDYILNEFTLKNNYGNFGTYVNNYQKIDNQSNSNSSLAHLRFINNYSEFSTNFSQKYNRVYGNDRANADDYLKRPITLLSANSLMATSNYSDYSGIILKESNRINQSDYETNYLYSPNGEIAKVTLNNNQELNYEYHYTNASEFSSVPEFNDIDFFGLAKYVKIVDDLSITNIEVFDFKGNLRLKILDSPIIGWSIPTQYSKLVKYFYDDNNNVTKIAEFIGQDNGLPQFRNIFYWYDEYNRIKHSYHPDFGYTHYSYDNAGNLRFKQDQKQFDKDRLTFFEYDDLNRLTVSGDAKIDPDLFIPSFSPSIDNSSGIENTIFNTMLDKNNNGEYYLNANILNDFGESEILTANKTLWYGTIFPDNCSIYDGIYNDTLKSIDYVPIVAKNAADILGYNYDIPPSGTAHKNYFYEDFEYPNSQNNGASPYAFEHLDWYKNFPRRINFYDELPNRIGRYWSLIPKYEFIEYLNNGELKNIKGRLSVQAYRDYEKQPFNFIFYSYDARGRIESLIRFTDNLGFDCVFYDYNSMDNITFMNVVTAELSITTWYDYDQYGRLSTIYSDLGDGHNLNSNINFLEGSAPLNSFSFSKLKPSGITPSIQYTYHPDNKISTVVYEPNSLNMSLDYSYESSLRLLNGIELAQNNNILFKEELAYDLIQRISSLKYDHFVDNNLVHTDFSSFNYDNLHQLTQWSDNSIMPPEPLQSFEFDPIGNRMSSMNFIDMPDPPMVTYAYDIFNSSRLVNATQAGKWLNQYNYFSNGQLKERKRSKRVVEAIPPLTDAIWNHTNEKFDYNSFALLREYKFSSYYAGFDCDEPFNENEETIWRYSYNSFNERESKRMIKSPAGDTDGSVYPNIYYLLDEKNRQHMNYLGFQISDESILSTDGSYHPSPFTDYIWPTCYLTYNPSYNGSKKETVFLYPVKLNVFGHSLSPLISYKYDESIQDWKKHFYIYDHLGNLQQSYSDSSGYAILELQQTYRPYGEKNWSNTALSGKALHEWIGQEKDAESSLGDHGVRKYDYETGRFTGIDPLWEKYIGWTPYQYSGNNPIMFLDWDGAKVRAMDGFSQQGIISSVESNYEKFVRFDDKGYVDAKYLRENLPADVDINSNAHTLMRLAENPAVAEVSTQIEFSFYNSKGDKLTKKFYQKGEQIYEEGVTLFTNAYTVFPSGEDAEFSDMFSGDDNTKIYLNPNRIGPGNTATDTAHELFYHFRMYLLGKKNGHDKINGDSPEVQDKIKSVEEKANK